MELCLHSIFFQIPMDKVSLLLVLLVCSQALEIGECQQRHSDGWSCLRCRENYHLFEGRCYIDILGCSEYHDGNICRQCDSHYMLVNNLCCDAVCLEKILAAPTTPKTVGNSVSGYLPAVLAVVEAGPLSGSLYKLVSVQSHKFIDVVRFYLMYHITSSFTQQYIVKRAVVDYGVKEKGARLVDWRQPATEGEFAKIGRSQVTGGMAVVGTFRELYPTVDAAGKYWVELDDLAEVKEYRVLHHDEKAGEANLKVFYRIQDQIVLLADETDPIDLFRPYRRTYSCEELKTSVPENPILEGAVTLALNTPELSGSDILQTTEWANDAKLITFRFSLGNSTHTGELILHYLTETSIFTIVSITVHVKVPPAPSPVKIPTFKDTVVEINGEKEETMTNIEHNDHAQSLISAVQAHLTGLTVESTRKEELHFVAWIVKTVPVRITLLTNCKYTEIALSYQNEGVAIFVYFLQENKSKDLTYLGTKNSTNISIDPSVGDLTSLASYSPTEFQSSFGFQPTFAKKAVKQIATRQTSFFKRTTLTVVSSSSTLDQYYMYSKVSGTSVSKLYSCVCKGSPSTHRSTTWSDAFGLQTIRSDNIQSITQRDEVAGQVLAFLHASHPQSAKWTVVQIELSEYELKLEYVFTLKEGGRYLLAVVLHDKKDHSNALVTVDEVTEEEWGNFEAAENQYEMIAVERLPKEGETDRKVTCLVERIGKEVSEGRIEGVLRSHETPSSEKNVILLQDQHHAYWIAISISSLEGDPILEQLRTIDAKIADLLLSSLTEDVLLTTQVESVSSGVIFEGEAFQIQSNIKEERLSEEMRLLVSYVEKQVGKIEGVLVNVEQHSDGVATEFALSFKTSNGSYVRYFVVRSQEAPNPLYFLGQETISTDPQVHLFFAPTPPLSQQSHESTFLNFIKKVNTYSSKHYDLKNILNLWTRNYPGGDYTVGYATDSVGQSACYILNVKEESYVLKWIETKGQNVLIQSVVPTLTVGLEKGSESVDLGVVVTQVVEVKTENSETTVCSDETTTIASTVGTQTTTGQITTVPETTTSVTTTSDVPVTTVSETASTTSPSITSEQTTTTPTASSEATTTTSTHTETTTETTSPTTTTTTVPTETTPTQTTTVSAAETTTSTPVVAETTPTQTATTTVTEATGSTQTTPTSGADTAATQTTTTEAAPTQTTTTTTATETTPTPVQTTTSVTTPAETTTTTTTTSTTSTETTTAPASETTAPTSPTSAPTTPGTETTTIPVAETTTTPTAEPTPTTPTVTTPVASPEPTKVETSGPVTTLQEKEDQPTVVITTSEPETVLTHEVIADKPVEQIATDSITGQETALETTPVKTETTPTTTVEPVPTSVVTGTTSTPVTEATPTSPATPTAQTTTTQTVSTTPTGTTTTNTETGSTVTSSTTSAETTQIDSTHTGSTSPLVPVSTPIEPVPTPSETVPTPSEPVASETVKTETTTTTTADIPAETTTTPVQTGIEEAPTTTTQTGNTSETTKTETAETTTTSVTPAQTTQKPTSPKSTTEPTPEPSQPTESTTSTQTQPNTPTSSETVVEGTTTTVTTTETTPIPSSPSTETTSASPAVVPTTTPTETTTPQPILISSSPINFLTVAIEYLKTQFIFSTCTLQAYTETKYTSGADETVTLTCPRGDSPMKANVSLSITSELKVTENYIKWYQPMVSTPSILISEPTPAPFVPPTIVTIPDPNLTESTETITSISETLISRVENVILEQIDPNELSEIQALQLITSEQKKDASLVSITTPSSVIEEIVVYLRASYVLLDSSAVIRVTQDVTRTGEVLRYVLYFFLAALPGDNYQVYRAIVDYDTSTSETRIFILAFDSYIKNNAVVAVGEPVTLGGLDVDIAYGYEKIGLTAVETDKAVQAVLAQIKTKYAELTRGRNLESVEWLELKSGKSNYRITFRDPATHLAFKFVVFYDPLLKKVLILNSINLPTSTQYSELSETERASDVYLQSVLQLLSELHHTEMQNYKLQCIGRATGQKSNEYHVTWSSEGRQFKSTLRAGTGGVREIAFAEVETISLDHYRLDEFEKLFIMNYQKLTDEEISGDGNFLLVLQALRNGNATLARSTLIGAAQKPMGLGYLFHLFFRFEDGSLVRAQVYLELYSLKVTLRNVKPEDFTDRLIDISQTDAAVKRVLTIISKQAVKPALAENYTVTRVQAKDFLFGQLFTVVISQEDRTYRAVIYHDQSTETVQLFTWTEVGVVANCLAVAGECCGQCVEGYSLLNGVCVFGCGTLCRQETH